MGPLDDVTLGQLKIEKKRLHTHCKVRAEVMM